MSAAIDDEELALSIPSAPRRSSTRAPDSPDSARHPPTDLTYQAVQQQQQRQEKERTSQRLGQYRIERTLGEGSFGKVKLAVHQISGQKVALKIINRRKLVTRDMAGRIEREIQYLQLLRHPHIIKLYTVITTPTEIIMVLEYAGGELFDYIVNNGRMPEDKARKFFQQIVCAVEYCHRHKIVHRDLKPENLLLDDNLNVKIADFGLSNIMTDGNFLKTSCGSPNYAAPEVISGKLYAGPEVDVWSCGVILYVLLVGRLPFDDEYIPALFKKIAQGLYSIPSYVSDEARTLIKKMLQVNPVHRITVYEIRQDPWFNKDLAPYLQLPQEEFQDTGVDPNKAIDPQDLNRSKPAAVVQKLHDSVVGKLGKTMGYAKTDVQEALAKDEPSAIKDAYLIVRENQIMKENPLLSQETSLLPFLAQSPPQFAGGSAGSPATTGTSSGAPTVTTTPAIPTRQAPSNAPAEDRPRQGSTSSATPNLNDIRSPISTIAILPSSLPDYHRVYMKGGPKPNTHDHSSSPKEQAPEDRAARARRLKPHSRSQLHLDKGNKPDAMTPLPAKKPRPTKWQFGIRSRNAPAEAMLAIYKALRAMDADWEVPRIRRPGGSRSRSRSSSGSSTSRSHSRHRPDSPSSSFSSSSSDRDVSPHSRQPLTVRNEAAGDSPTRGRVRARKRYDKRNDWGYHIPEDPWVINARFRKEGMFPPGVLHPSSTHSSRVDLQNPSRRASTANGSHASHHADIGEPGTAGYAGPASGRNSVAGSETGRGSGSGRNSKTGQYADADEAVFVYVTIQIYSIEKEFFLVDFKCAGYERLVHKLVREIRETGLDTTQAYAEVPEASTETGGNIDIDDSAFNWRPVSSSENIAGEMDVREREETVGAGRASGEKRATSPYPFLDVASRLIIQLAEGE